MLEYTLQHLSSLCIVINCRCFQGMFCPKTTRQRQVQALYSLAFHGDGDVVGGPLPNLTQPLLPTDSYDSFAVSSLFADSPVSSDQENIHRTREKVRTAVVEHLRGVVRRLFEGSFLNDPIRVSSPQMYDLFHSGSNDVAENVCKRPVILEFS